MKNRINIGVQYIPYRVISCFYALRQSLVLPHSPVRSWTLLKKSRILPLMKPNGDRDY